MIKPEYLVQYFPYTNQVRSIYRVVGETEKYWKINLNETYTEYINKRTLRVRGGDVQYYAWSKEQVIVYKQRSSLETIFARTNPKKLSIEQLEKIVKIIGGM